MTTEGVATGNRYTLHFRSQYDERAIDTTYPHASLDAARRQAEQCSRELIVSAVITDTRQGIAEVCFGDTSANTGNFLIVDRIIPVWLQDPAITEALEAFRRFLTSVEERRHGDYKPMTLDEIGDGYKALYDAVLTSLQGLPEEEALARLKDFCMALVAVDSDWSFRHNIMQEIRREWERSRDEAAQSFLT